MVAASSTTPPRDQGQRVRRDRVRRLSFVPPRHRDRLRAHPFRSDCLATANASGKARVDRRPGALVGAHDCHLSQYLRSPSKPSIEPRGTRNACGPPTLRFDTKGGIVREADRSAAARARRVRADPPREFPRCDCRSDQTPDTRAVLSALRSPRPGLRSNAILSLTRARAVVLMPRTVEGHGSKIKPNAVAFLPRRNLKGAFGIDLKNSHGLPPSTVIALGARSSAMASASRRQRHPGGGCQESSCPSSTTGPANKLSASKCPSSPPRPSPIPAGP